MAATKNTDAPYFVYEMRDEDGVLLYVGISHTFGKRLATHERSKPWWDRVADVRATRYATRLEAERAESDMIASHNPAFNITGHPFGSERRAYSWRVDLLQPRDPLPLDQLLDLAEMAAWMRFTIGTAKNYYRQGRLPPPDAWREETPLWRVATIDLWDAARKGIASDVA